MNNDTVRLLILDTSGVYTQIYDEIYVLEKDVGNMKKAYSDYLVVEVPKDK